jgi:hypothetical protein
MQVLEDLATFIGWLWGNITDIFGNVFLPIKYIYTFIKQFFVSAFGPPIETSDLWTFPSDILGVFNTIPHFDVFIQGAIIAVIIALSVAIVKSFQNT